MIVTSQIMFWGLIAASAAVGFVCGRLWDAMEDEDDVDE